MNIALWIVQVLLALLFLFAGTLKFIMPYDEMIKDAPVVFPHWFFLFIGTCEVLGGIGLVLPWALKIKPRLTPLAAWLLLIIMIGAVVTGAMGGIALAVPPFIVGLLLGFVGYGRSRSTSLQ